MSLSAADASTFLNESVDGGSVTVYTANGTPATLQLRWAKTDSVANGGSDTWNLFYMTNSTATGTNPAWQNVGTDFVFNSSGQLNPPINSVALTGVTVNNVAVGNITINSSAGCSYPIRQHEWNRNGQQHAAERLFGRRAAVDFSVQYRRHFRHLHQRSKRRARLRPVGAFQQPQQSRSTWTAAPIRRRSIPGPALAGASGKIVGQSLEGSNTDIATEFTKLIVTQQAYSANTKVITTANQMSQDLMNILR